MATKKQKRESALAKRKSFLEQERLIGLSALEESREARKEEWRSNHDKRHFKFVDECPLCQDAKKQLARQAKADANA